MPTTTFDPDNALNLAETAAVATINDDAWLGSTTNVPTVHQKVRMGEDPFGLYYAHELPAIGVLSAGGSPDDKHVIGEFEEFIRLHFDIWAFGADFDAADTCAKTVIARLRSLMRLQTFSPTVNVRSSQLNGFAANGEVANEDYDLEYFPAEDGGWLVHGVTTTLLTLLSAT